VYFLSLVGLITVRNSLMAQEDFLAFQGSRENLVLTRENQAQDYKLQFP
jgi:hypothetical protein